MVFSNTSLCHSSLSLVHSQSITKRKISSCVLKCPLRPPLSEPWGPPLWWTTVPLIQSPPTRTSGRTLLSTIALHVNFFPTIPLHVNFCKWNQGIAPPFQLLEYKTDVRRCRFDTLGKLTSAHRTGAPTARERWVCSRTVGESDCPLATVAGPRENKTFDGIIAN